MTSTVTTISEVRQAVARARQRGLTVGLVPTMGALHAGHLSLIKGARAETGFVVVSIFVNPTQFGPNEDLARYPRPIDQDLALCQNEGVDLVFHPDVSSMYPPGSCTYAEVYGLQEQLCGRSRPGHFRGVATVVLKLFNIVQPDFAYFGQKDAQQARIIQQLVRDLDVPVQLRIYPIVREPDGLALSSRNQYLDPNQRRNATVLFRALRDAQGQIEAGERRSDIIRHEIVQRIGATPGALIDYAELVDADSLRPVEELKGTVLIALAVKFGATRLLDNATVHVPQ
jgi:pantoate--beta-alanine ligase